MTTHETDWSRVVTERDLELQAERIDRLYLECLRRRYPELEWPRLPSEEEA